MTYAPALNCIKYSVGIDAGCGACDDGVGHERGTYAVLSK